jgi:Predicted metal-dependent hydrolase with the TIM-barrel fold
MAVMTVTGEVSKDKLGIISPHEHIYIDIRNQFREFHDISRKTISEQKVGIQNLDKLSRSPYALKDNLILDNEETAENELLEFKKAGGDTIVDATPKGIGRDPVLLKRISRLLGINIIAGCGYYTADTHPTDMDSKTIEEIADEIMTDLTMGIDGTNIKAGVIGELGISKEIYPNEAKVLAASAKVQLKTGVGILVHTYPWGNNGIEALKILVDNGATCNKICICHIDVDISPIYIKEIIKSGAFVEFDNFGKEYFIDKRDRGFAGGIFARDIDRVKAIKELIDLGCINRILVSCDICLKTLLHKFGGWGYDHILTNIVPMMKEVGITDDQINAIINENPKAFLDNGKP